MAEPPEPASSDDHVREVEAWAAHRLERLTADDGWLTVVGLEWLEPEDNTIGSGPANRVRLPRGPERLGSIFVSDAGLRLNVLPGVQGLLGPGGEVRGTIGLLDDRDGREPTRLRLGTLTFFVIVREGRRAVRVKDARAPARERFAGIERWPVDARWRVEARFEPLPPGASFLAPDVLGTGQTYAAPGVLRFDLAGTPCRLVAFQEPGEDELFLVFGDRTNGTDTFAGGRYLYAKAPDASGIVVLDFNRTYNPPCVFTAFATCALPLEENRLAVRVEAGEKRYEGPGTGH
jgi:uncharacterized protein (DUF1684 family)